MITLGDPAVSDSLLLRIRSLEHSSPRRWGKMTAHQMICHLTDSFRGVLGEKYISAATGLQSTRLYRTVAKQVGLYAPVPWPHGVPSRPEVEQGKGGTPPGDFELDRQSLIRALEQFRASEGFLRTASHPIFGLLTLEEWLRWGYLHTDHHLRQFGV